MVKKRLIFLERILGTLLLAAFALAPAAAQTRQQQKQQFLKSVDESISVSQACRPSLYGFTYSRI
jgi:hypothetical protein